MRGATQKRTIALQVVRPTRANVFDFRGQLTRVRARALHALQLDVVHVPRQDELARHLAPDRHVTSPDRAVTTPHSAVTSLIRLLCYRALSGCRSHVTELIAITLSACAVTLKADAVTSQNDAWSRHRIRHVTAGVVTSQDGEVTSQDLVVEALAVEGQVMRVAHRMRRPPCVPIRTAVTRLSSRSLTSTTAMRALSPTPLLTPFSSLPPPLLFPPPPSLLPRFFSVLCSVLLTCASLGALALVSSADAARVDLLRRRPVVGPDPIAPLPDLPAAKQEHKEEE
eukprot:1114197-Rhodomonas_salina.1